MAIDTTVYSSTKEVLTVQDYTGTPNSVTVTLIPDTFTGPVIDAVSSGEIMKASSTGQTRHATPVTGLAGGQTGSFQAWLNDAKNDTDKSARSLLQALAGNSVSGTGHSAETYTSQLTGGGRLQCKLVRAITSEGGITTTATYPAVITGVSEQRVNGALALQVDFLLVGAVTRA